MADLVATHFAPGARTGQEGTLSSSPAHDPSAEQITDVEVDEDTATVRSVIQTAGNTTYYYEYHLLRGDDGWRISQLSTFLDPPGTPLIDPARAEALMQSATPEAILPDLQAHLRLRGGSRSWTWVRLTHTSSPWRDGYCRGRMPSKSPPRQT
ncbi:hypothetical protein [Pseudarthrobacter sp. AB1]|uniref:hypothetical protein n=1 Tax=Pseudarthrobacter sp. AB1 TaxID=2138309 RepID=UPI00186B962F|nr:hypothetical protein [Pseudarthrobacter sp. AB1]